MSRASASMTQSMVQYLSECTGKRINQINIIPGFVEPSDMAEIKRIAAEMGIKVHHVSRHLGRSQRPSGRQVPHVSQGRSNRRADQRAPATAHLPSPSGRTASLAAAKLLDTKCKVPFEMLDLPIGLRATDAFIDSLRKTAGVRRPGEPHDRAGPGGRRDDRHAPVLLPEESRPRGRPGPSDLADSVPYRHRHGRAVRRDGNAGRTEVREPNQGACRGERPVKHGPTADMFRFHQLRQEREAGPHLRQYLCEVYRPGRGHTARSA